MFLTSCQKSDGATNFRASLGTQRIDHSGVRDSQLGRSGFICGSQGRTRCGKDVRVTLLWLLSCPFLLSKTHRAAWTPPETQGIKAIGWFCVARDCTVWRQGWTMLLRMGTGRASQAATNLKRIKHRHVGRGNPDGPKHKRKEGLT